MIPAIIVHDSARMTATESVTNTLREATLRGFEILSKGGSALDAVETAVKSCEDSGVFNAGIGAHLNLIGEAETEASMMDGKNLNSGGVAILRGIKNPISVARRILEAADKTMVILAGEGAYRFAKTHGLEEIDAPNPERLKYWKELRDALNHGRELPGINLADPTVLKNFLRTDTGEGTVGAVAIDKQRNLASGVSSGGTPLKLPGRLGDIPIIGCSNYADNAAGAVSLTGTGNIMVRYAVARWITDIMRNGVAAQKATEEVVAEVNKRVAKCVLGVVAIDSNAGLGAARNLEGMPHMYMVNGMSSPSQLPAPIIKTQTQS